MSLIIDNYDFEELEIMKYWQPPSSWSEEKKKETTRNRIFSGDWIGSRKMDGAFYCFIKDDEGNVVLRGRSKSTTGVYLNKYDWVPHMHGFFDSIPKGTCLLGEIVFPNNEGSNKTTTIMGCKVEKAIERQKSEKISYYIFDVLAWDGMNLINVPIYDRISYLEYINQIIYDTECNFIITAEYFSGEKLWTLLQTILANGGEGIVMTKKDCVYQPGKRPSAGCQKVKKELQDTVDCFFTGKATAPNKIYTGKEIETWKYWEDLRTGEKIEGNKYKEYFDGALLEPITKNYFYGFAGSLEIGVLKDGKVFPIGTLSGLNEEIKANFKEYAFKCIEVSAMQFTEDKALRHGKMIRFRPDLTPDDCTWEKIFG